MNVESSCSLLQPLVWLICPDNDGENSLGPPETAQSSSAQGLALGSQVLYFCVFKHLHWLHKILQVNLWFFYAFVFFLGGSVIHTGHFSCWCLFHVKSLFLSTRYTTTINEMLTVDRCVPVPTLCSLDNFRTRSQRWHCFDTAFFILVISQGHHAGTIHHLDHVHHRTAHNWLFGNTEPGRS